MFLIDWRLTVLSLGLLPFFMYLTYRVGKVRREVSTETQKSLAEMSALTEETLSVSGILLSKTFGQQENSINKFRGLNASLAALQIRQAMVGRWFFMIIGTIFSITPAFVYWLAGWLTIQGDPTAPTIGDIVAFTTLQSRLFFPLGQLLNVQVEIQGALALFDRIFEYLEMDAEIVDAPDAVELAPRRCPRPGPSSATSRSAIRRQRCRRRRCPASPSEERRRRPCGPPRRSTEAVERLADAPGIGDGIGPRDDPGLRARGHRPRGQPGELVALVGPSGSGKTTTTYLIPRLYDVDEGAVEIDGIDVRKIKLASLGEIIGVRDPGDVPVPRERQGQPPVRPARGDRGRARGGRASGRHARPDHGAARGLRHDRRRARLQAVGRREAAHRHRRVLLKDPRILILDEATSALDTVSERLIQAAFERLMEGRTTIAIAHRLSTILRADRILVYDRGRIVERGTHAELLAQGGLYARLYREQFLTEQSEGAPTEVRVAG